ncbi:MAG: phosphoribosylglycinamide formyltransferase [Synechococcus sp.]
MPAFSDLSQQIQSEQTPLRIGVMASGNGSNFEALAHAVDAGTLMAEISMLVVNNPGCGAQQRAQRLGVPCTVLDHRVLKERERLDRTLVDCFRSAAVEVVVMAGWMRIVTPVLINGYSGRLVNIHPSLLPSFKGLDGIGQALAAGVKITGCSVHLVTAELDGGPILAQAAVPVWEGDDHASLSERVHQAEHRLLPEALSAMIPVWRQG